MNAMGDKIEKRLKQTELNNALFDAVLSHQMQEQRMLGLRIPNAKENRQKIFRACFEDITRLIRQGGNPNAYARFGNTIMQEMKPAMRAEVQAWLVNQQTAKKGLPSKLRKPMVL